MLQLIFLIVALVLAVGLVALVIRHAGPAAGGHHGPDGHGSDGHDHPPAPHGPDGESQTEEIEQPAAADAEPPGPGATD